MTVGMVMGVTTTIRGDDDDNDDGCGDWDWLIYPSFFVYIFLLSCQANSWLEKHQDFGEKTSSHPPFRISPKPSVQASSNLKTSVNGQASISLL